jgi:hypothetical protein
VSALIGFAEMDARDSTSWIIGEIQFLRLNVVPPYTLDDDEGQRSEDEYVAFYRKNIVEAIRATDAYIEAFGAIVTSPESQEAFNTYLGARRRFVQSYPFCDDELASESPAEYQALTGFLREQFVNGRINSGELDILRRFRSLLEQLRSKIQNE